MAACDLEPENCDLPLLRHRVVQANSGKLSAQGTAICLAVALDEVERLRAENEELRTLTERHKSNFEWWRKQYYESLDTSMELIIGNTELRNENERLTRENRDLTERLKRAETVVAAARPLLSEILRINPIRTSRCIHSEAVLDAALAAYDAGHKTGDTAASGEIEGEG